MTEVILPVGEDDPPSTKLAREAYASSGNSVSGLLPALDAIDAALTLTRQQIAEKDRELTGRVEPCDCGYKRVSLQLQAEIDTLRGAREIAKSREAALRAELATAQADMLTIGEQKQALLAELKRRGVEIKTLKQEQAKKAVVTHMKQGDTTICGAARVRGNSYYEWAYVNCPECRARLQEKGTTTP